ncbi:glycosyltransferase family 2 protein [Thalassobius sp. Cn5-15]|uniref:glycosyltransferase family 2 protein n=1 Tax=Thalassobius sp. Cn5-15 TaxID=2917763 RepID=UPI001EF276BA|nr:glycosyltransferase family 2 protein [Thalassobius sp. Cn5-15]MCG7492859.1 glycosyltransferase family 2 protein [Thalassobius sp. Cn5-15]
MQIYLHIGMEQVGAARIQDVLAQKREQLEGKGILFPRGPGGKNHTRLYMAATDPDHVDTLRYNRGFIDPSKQRELFLEVQRTIVRDVAAVRPEKLILSASQLGASLARRSELERLKSLLAPLEAEVIVVAHIDEQARLLTRRYAAQVMEGRATSLTREMDMAGSADWWDDALLDGHKIAPEQGEFLEIQHPAFWLDYARLQSEWEAVFGEGCMRLRPYDEALIYSEDVTDEIRAMFDIEQSIGRANAADIPAEPSAAWITRGRLMNEQFLHLLKHSNKLINRQMWRKFMAEIEVDGAPLSAGSLSSISEGFAAANKALLKAHPALTKACLTPDSVEPDWEEADPTKGFRATQYLLSFLHRINKFTREERDAKQAELEKLRAATPMATEATPAPTKTAPAKPKQPAEKPKPKDGLSDAARAIMPPLAVQNFEKLQTSSFKPHNDIGTVEETQKGRAYRTVKPRKLPKGSTGNVIVGCMKNEAPYIVEWVAYHRAIGVDNFLIYTNDCSDGTSEILDRLQEMGILQHRNNDKWKGNSPQQYALNQAQKEPVLQNAEWIAHIDVDEFINVRCGNGTLQAFFKEVPDATNVAMTWRLFGHNNVQKLDDSFVIGQFDKAAPKFCPKPHTVWGFKTMFKNIGAYEKISCHRPNKLGEDFKTKVKWVNGSGKDMTREASEKGWRSSKKSIGYDLIQLNHYALRSAESYLVKRQRGRALHVDRSIGLNYWIRMDWSDFTDLTIQRNLPRLQAEYDRLMQDDTLREWHDKGYAWHQAKAAELHDMDEFEDLYQQAIKLKLSEIERVAYALALDMES